MTTSAHPLKTEIKRILVPTDFSERSKKALLYARALAEKQHAEIDLLHVISLSDEGAIYGSAYYPVYEKEFLDASDKQLDEMLKSVEAPEGELKTFTRSGSPVHEIVEFAQENEIDLIVIATHGHRGLKHFLLGSTTENVIRHAKCPVLVVRENEHEFVSET